MNKAICIDAQVYGLTLNKIYDVVSEDDKYYEVIDDDNRSVIYYKRRFKLLGDLRLERINEILDDE